MTLLSRGIAGIGWFFRWWFGTLAGLIPPAARRLFHPRRDTVIIDVSGPEARVVRCGDDAGKEVARFPLGPGSAGDEEIAAARRALAAAGAPRHATALRLSPAQALSKVLTLPAAAEATLRDVLFHQIGLHTPFPADEASFGYRVTHRDPRAGRITVELTVAPRKFVAAALARAEAWGLKPEIVDISRGEPLAPPEINLIEGESEGGRADLRPRLNVLLALAAGSLAVAAVLIPLDAARDRAETLLAEAAELRRASQEVLDLRQRRDALAASVRTLADGKLGRPSTLKVLDELTRIIPADTWLYEIQVSGSEIRMSGYSPAAASLIGRIAESPLFRNPRFRSPVTRPARLEKERFNLSFELAELVSEGRN